MTQAFCDLQISFIKCCGMCFNHSNYMEHSNASQRTCWPQAESRCGEATMGLQSFMVLLECLVVVHDAFMEVSHQLRIE